MIFIKPIQKMSASEMEVMLCIWKAGGSITSASLQEELDKQKKWKLNTILTFLHRLTEKGILKTEKNGRGKVNQYTALISESEYKHFETYSFLKTVHDGSVKSLMVALYDGDDISKNDIEQLKEWFSQR